MASVARMAVRRMSTATNSTIAARLKSSSEHSQSWETYKKVSLFVALPLTFAVGYKAFFIAEHPHAEEFVPYSHLRVRRKAFPWGDGNHSLFHTDQHNVLPEGWVEGCGPDASH
eukprot:m.411116 g.411116  ORF g.411116 m.411116 type:complete len:114 (-) comp28575_c0_seq1:115-456(-)